MKQLNKEELHGVIRDIDEAGCLVKWLAESRDENRQYLEAAPIADVPRLQGENTAINQILDKLTEKV